MMSDQNGSAPDNLIWLLDDEFGFDQINHLQEILRERGYDLAVTRGETFKEDYPKYAPYAKGILLQVGFPLCEEDIKGLSCCRIISVTGIGYNDLDLEAATQHGIVSTNVPGFCMDEVSDHTLALILALYRRLPECRDMITKGIWKAVDIGSMRRLKGQVLGLVGFGRIGREVARKAKCFGFNVKVYDPYLPGSKQDLLNVELADFDDLIRTSDVISLHVPLNKETYHWINAVVFEAMKDTAYLINTCRGDVVNEADLIHALKTKKIAGAGLDVLSQEPPEVRNPLLFMPNVIVSPHAAFISNDSLNELCVKSAKAIFDKLDGNVPENVINPEVLRVK